MRQLISIDNERIYEALQSRYIEIAETTMMKDLIINENNVSVLHNSLVYFLGCKGKYDTNKGLMLCGDFGIGKSTLFLTMRAFINKIFPYSVNSFVISSIEEIIHEKSLINSLYLNNVQFGIRNPKHLLINEFGHSYNIKNYGSNTDDIVESFLMKRYDLFQHEGKLTHITTNLIKKELASKYPPVIIDRFKEMFNIVEVGGVSFRK